MIWALPLAILAASPAVADPTIYYGADAGATATSARPNSTAARASFAAAVGTPSAPITFESLAIGYGTGVYSLGSGVTATLTGVDTTNSGISTVSDPTLGFNTTTGGSKELLIVPTFANSTTGTTATLTFSFASAIDAFGANFTGYESLINNVVATFNDGSSRTYSIAGTTGGGVLFSGFTDAGKAITSVSFTESLSAGTTLRDIFAIDDVVYHLAATPVPEPSSWAIMFAGFGYAGAMLRRRSRTRTVAICA